MVDVGREHGTASGYFVTHELWGNVALDAQLLAVHVLTYGNVFHLRGDDAGLGVSHLGDVLSSLGTTGQLDVFEAEMVETVVGKAHLAIVAAHLAQLFGVITVEYPLFSLARQTFLQVYLIVGVAVRTTGVIDKHRSVGFGMRNAPLVLYDGRSEVYLGHSNPDLREAFSLHIRLFSFGVGFVVLWHNLKGKKDFIWTFALVILF